MLWLTQWLTALLSLALLAANSASAVAAISGQNSASGSLGSLEHRLGKNSLASADRLSELKVPADVWAKMSAAEQWAANTRFLGRMIARGDEIILATPAGQARAGSFFARELEYLTGRGYGISADGTRLLPPIGP